MAVAALFALALLAQDPAAPAAPAAPPIEGPIPPGAPEDDYGLVAWCHGALTGHMALYDTVKPELDKLSDDPSRAELDREQMAAGRDYLALYARALEAAERASPRPLRQRGDAARKKGMGIWTPAANATDPKTRMWSWLLWDLPGRCETAAKRLEERSLLAAPAVRGAEPEAAAAEAEQDDPLGAAIDSALSASAADPAPPAP